MLFHKQMDSDFSGSEQIIGEICTNHHIGGDNTAHSLVTKITISSTDPAIRIRELCSPCALKSDILITWLRDDLSFSRTITSSPMDTRFAYLK